jgi:hypothetical protein
MGNPRGKRHFNSASASDFRVSKQSPETRRSAAGRSKPPLARAQPRLAVPAMLMPAPLRWRRTNVPTAQANTSCGALAKRRKSADLDHDGPQPPGGSRVLPEAPQRRELSTSSAAGAGLRTPGLRECNPAARSAARMDKPYRGQSALIGWGQGTNPSVSPVVAQQAGRSFTDAVVPWTIPARRSAPAPGRA